uniref:protein-serine/threonine phosphatase n=1 Tax=Timema douglasi TaxID=61478 RepID=A0A7R8ZF27_TIMDO|nr:unnamed protein product [Timema douglasi]
MAAMTTMIYTVGLSAIFLRGSNSSRLAGKQLSSLRRKFSPLVGSVTQLYISVPPTRSQRAQNREPMVREQSTRMDMSPKPEESQTTLALVELLATSSTLVPIKCGELGPVESSLPTTIFAMYLPQSGDHVTSSSTPQENGEATDEKGKSKIKCSSPISSSADKKHNALTAAALYQSWLRASSDSEDDDDDDEGDESFEGQDESEEGDEDEDAGKEEEEGDEDDEDEDEEEEEEEDLSMKVMEEPGADSGCTAVVALLKDQELYVANAGDSRCVVCRKGEAIEMSLDHKPEDDVEMERIVKAGGKVTGDGRVNGGLNLSRALGTY